MAHVVQVKRRRLLTASASAVALTTLSSSPAAQVAANAVQSYTVGDFVLHRQGSGLRIAHRQSPDRVLWQSADDADFIVAETADAKINAFGTPQGSYEITDSISATFGRPSIVSISTAPDRATVSGMLAGAAGERPYTLSFVALSPNQLQFEIKADSVNRIRLRLASTATEAFFGFGQQLTYFNQKGNVLPILVQEHGIGRGQPVVTQIVDVFANGGGRNPYVTCAPAPHFISSELRSLCLENTEYSVFDMRPVDHLEIKLWSGVMTGRILYGDSPLALIEAYTEYSGRMRKLPDWIHEGVIAGVQGGTAVVRSKLTKLRRAGVPLAALWIQDWVGTRVTSSGKQLWWNWRLDETQYPQWRQLVADLERQGTRMMIYINPFLSNTKGHDALFAQGKARGYLVKKPDGTPYLIKNSDFFAGLIDLSNPETRTWIKSVIKEELLNKAGASGWMADFGEALPFDGKLHGNANAAEWHNRFAQEWAKVNREAIEEAGRGDDVVFFSRSGFTKSPASSTLFWLGDQDQTWDAYDGIKTAVVGMLSGGMSGFSLVHSDVGGFDAFQISVLGKKIAVMARSNELLQRWMELAAFTCVFRTHEGLIPDISAQFDSDPANTAHLVRFGKIYRGLASYRKRLVAEATQRGYPVVRHLFLHYPNDPNTHKLRYQFMLGPDLMVAPVLDKGAATVQVYFPAGSAWIDLWSGAEVGKAGKWESMPAPLSKPAVFLRKDAPSTSEIVNGLKSVGVL